MLPKKLYIVCAALLVLGSGCKKFVQIASPTTQLVTTSVFSTDGTATSAQLVIYSQMVTNTESFNMAEETGLLGDELINYASNSGQVQFYTNSMEALGNPGPWTNAYNYIYQANSIIAGLQNNSAISPAVQQQLTGESLFIRAFWHFYLTSLYGDVPLVTTTTYTTNASLPRTPQAQVYQQVIKDLIQAQGMLNGNFVDGSDTVITTDRVRPTKWAATALLARVYLYTGDYADAETQATAVIGNTTQFSLCPNLNNVFLANSTEAIWQLAIPLPTNNNTPDGANFILIFPPFSFLPVSVSLSTQMMASFEAGDNRKTDWVGTYSAGVNYYYPYKYKVKTGSTVTEYDMVLRLAEQYLIRAEAESQTGDLGDAANDLNVIRNRAGLANVADTTAASQTDLLAAVLHERQTELFTEWGNRWLDLIRTGNIDAVMSVVAPLKNGTWVPGTDSLYPIPQNNISLDPSLTQNPGY